MTTMSKKSVRNLAFLTMLAVAVPCVASAQPADGLRGNIDMVTSSMNNTDVEKNVERALNYNLGVDIFDLEVTAYNGGVIINGGVDLPVQIERATQIANSLGIDDVTNNMGLKREMPEYQRMIDENNSDA